MSTLALDTRSPAPREPAHDALTLRISGGGLDGRLVRLSSAKCTVGSGPRCTLRLLGPGIRPLHCLIVRGTQGTFVRRWSPETRLNGRSFEDATLRAGDRLSVGPVELEVLPQAGAAHQSVPSAALVARPVPPAVPSVPVGLPACQALPALAAHTESEIAQLSDDIRTQISNLRSRARRLVDALRESRMQQQELESRVRASLQAQREAECRLQELGSSARDSDTRSTEFQATIQRLERQIAALTAELEAQRKQQLELTEQLEDAQSREAALRLATQAGDAALRSRATAQDDAFQSNTPPEADSNEDAEAAIAHLRSQSLWNDSTPLAAEARSPRYETPGRTSRAPVSFIEQYAPHLLDDGPDHEQSGKVDDPTAKAARAGTRVSNTSDHETDRAAVAAIGKTVPGTGKDPSVASRQGEDDESLEEYMAKLMQRVRGPDQQPTQPAFRPQDRRLVTVPIIPNVATERVGAPDNPTMPAFRLEDIKRALPPERAGGLAAMRELANQSAHRAISRYRAQRGTRDAFARLLAAAVCLAGGISVLFLEPDRLSVAGAGGAVAIAASAYFAVRGLGSLLILNRGGSDADEPFDSADEAQAAELGDA